MKSKRLVTELETFFYDMNSVSYRTETETVTTTVVDEFGSIAYDEEGKPQTESTTTLYIYIDSRSLDYREEILTALGPVGKPGCGRNADRAYAS